METSTLLNSSKIKEIEVTLKSTSQEYEITNNTITIPSHFDSSKLNKLVKKLIQTKENFNFFIDNILLETSLDDFLLTHVEILKSSEEKTLEIFYSIQINKPNLSNTIKEDEWIRKISIRNLPNYKYDDIEYYCVGLFNSEVNIYNSKFEKVIKIEEQIDENYCELLHDILFFKNENDNILIKCSRNEDENVKVYSIDLNKNSYTQIYTYYKQGNEYFNSLSLNPANFYNFVAGDTESNLHIIKIDENYNENRKSNKKRKTEIHSLESLCVIEKCHIGEIKNVKWINNQQILTSGDDFQVKLWNTATKTNYSSYNLNYKFCTSLSNIPTTDCFLTGLEDGRIKLWDMRQNQFANVYSGHSYCISDISVIPNNINNFTSVAYDGKVKMWDIRSTRKSIHDINTDCEKLYTVSYNTNEILMTGGDSSSVQVYKI